MSEHRPRKPLGSYLRNPGNEQAEQRPRKPIGSYFRQPGHEPAQPEDTQPDIPGQDDDTGEPIQAGLDENALFLSQQDTPYVREEQNEPPLQQAILEPDRYQPPQGQSRLGREVQIDKFGRQIVTDNYIDLPQASRRQGLYIIGIQGTGKSGLIENLIIQDINQDRGVALLDPHGDLTNAVLSRLPSKREKDVIYLDIADEDYPFGLNLFTCSNPNSPKAVQIVVDKVRHIFEKLLGVSHDTPLLLEYLTNCARTLIANPGYTMADIPLLLQDREWRKKLVANVIDSDVQRFWRHHEQKKPADQIYEISSTLRRVDEFLLPLSRPIVGQSTTIDLQSIMDEGKILLVKLSAQLPSVSSLIGSMFVALFLNAAYARPANKRRQFNLYADEFQRFATEDFATLLEEARKFGIATTIAHQNRGQLDSKNETLDANLKDRTRSVANLVVFKVNSVDANGLAGEFDIVPQEAWEQEIEPERIKVLRPQRHEKKVEQVEVEVEEEIQEISQNPVDHLVRGSHGSVRVRKVTQAMLAPLVEAVERRTGAIPTIDQVQLVRKGTIKGELFPSPLNEKKITYNRSYYLLHEVQEGKTLINRLLVDVMEKRVAVEYSSELTARIQKIVLTLSGYIGWFGVYENVSDYYWRIGWSQQHEPDATLYHSLASLIQRIVDNDNVAPSYSAFCFELKRCVSQVYKPEQKEYEYERTQFQNRISEWADQGAGCARDFISNLVILCKGLATDPILVGTGQKRMVKRIQPHITYLTHESEKITIPRKTIMHPQRTYADMHNEVASQLTNLPVFTAQVKISTETGRTEHTIRTLRPEAGLQGKALQERLDSIKQQNIDNGYVRERAKVEEEIKLRQEQFSKPQEDDEPPEEPPVTRRQRNER